MIGEDEGQRSAPRPGLVAQQPVEHDGAGDLVAVQQATSTTCGPGLVAARAWSRRARPCCPRATAQCRAQLSSTEKCGTAPEEVAVAAIGGRSLQTCPDRATRAPRRTGAAVGAGAGIAARPMANKAPVPTRSTARREKRTVFIRCISPGVCCRRGARRAALMRASVLLAPRPGPRRRRRSQPGLAVAGELDRASGLGEGGAPDPGRARCARRARLADAARRRRCRRPACRCWWSATAASLPARFDGGSGRRDCVAAG